MALSAHSGSGIQTGRDKGTKDQVDKVNITEDEPPREGESDRMAATARISAWNEYGGDLTSQTSTVRPALHDITD